MQPIPQLDGREVRDAFKKASFAVTDDLAWAWIMQKPGSNAILVIKKEAAYDPGKLRHLYMAAGLDRDQFLSLLD